jgi:cyclophilin family peptidyl-prolyl cis-trans isomerase
VKTTYKRGTIAMARKGGVANSADSQFFIVLDDTKAQDLAAPGYNNYAIFGSVTQGMDVVDAIAAVPLGGEPVSGNPPSMPLVPIVITSTIVTTP